MCWVIVVLDAPRLFVLREETDEMRVELTEEHGGTLLTFEHEFDAPGAPASFATGWDGCLAELEQALAGTSSPPEDEAQRAARRRAYAQVFGELS
jgi:Activator of Hsp90 ATPase homolog 1-like protein